MKRLADIICELGDATRLRVLSAILDTRKNVSQIVAELEFTQPQVSYHLRKLKDAGLAVEEKDGRWVWYQADWESPDARVRELLALLARWSGDGDGVESAVARKLPDEGIHPPVERPVGVKRDELEDFLL